MIEREPHRGRILLVEDEALIALSEIKTLEKHGYEVITACSGEKAVETATQDTGISLVLMDIDLGSGIDGTEAAEQILKKRSLPIVFLTSHSEREYVERVKRITSYGYVLKSSGEFVLIESITMALQLFHSHEELKAKQEQLALAMDAEDHGYWDWNLDTNEVYFSPRYCEMLGYHPDEFPPRYQTWEELLHPEDRESAVETVRERVKRAEPFELEFRLQTKSGDWKWIKGSGNSYRMDQEGIPHRVVGTHEDITERKQAEQELHEKAALLQRITDNIGDVVGITDLSGTFTYHTDFPPVTGYGKGALVGKNVFDFIHPDDLECVQSAFKEFIAYQQEGRRVEYRLRCADGSHIWMEADGTVIKDEEGNTKELLFSARDISERKMAEAELQEQRALLQSIVDNVPGQLFVLDREHRYMTANTDALTFMGVDTVDEVVGKTVFDFFPKDLAQRLYADDEEVFATGKSPVTEEWQLIDKSGATRWVLATKVPFADETGEFKGMIVISHDITERKQEREQLQATLKEKQLLMQELNHRVKNNLSLVSSLIGLKESSLDGEVDLSDLRNQVNAIAIVHESLQESDDITHIDLKNLMTGILSAVFHPSRGQHVTIENEIPDVSVPTKAAVPLGLIINETATNAVKHAFTGEDEARFAVAMKADSAGNNYVLTITNTGRPLPEEVDMENPQGLGLQLVSALVAQLRGTLELQRKPQPMFTIRFPIPE